MHRQQPIHSDGLEDDELSSGLVKWSPSGRQRAIMATASILSLMVALDACIIVTSLQAIVADLALSTYDGFWIGTAYLLANAVMMLFISDASRVFGRRPCLTVSVALFALGTIFCCVAHSIGFMLVGRSLQGVGGAGIIVLCLLIFTDFVPLPVRPTWYGLVQAAWALGNCVGPILGGVIAQHTTWRWVFYIMFPFCVAGLILVPWLVNIDPPADDVREKLKKMDWLGNSLFIGSATLLLVAVSWGGLRYSLGCAGTLAPLLLGVLGMALTMIYESRFAALTFLQRRLFQTASSVATYACGAIQGLVMYGQLYYVPLYFMDVKGFTPVQTGIALFPVMFTLVPASIITGRLVTVLDNYQWPIWVGWTLATIASGLMMLWDVDTPTKNMASQALCDKDDEAIAAAMYAFLRQFGMALGVGVGGSTFQNVVLRKLEDDGLAPAGTHGGTHALSAMLSAVGDAGLRSKIVDAYVYGLRGVYGLYVGVSGLALLMSLFIRSASMDRRLRTEHALHTQVTGRGSIHGSRS
ncbi:major facilitator superfamily domain-containing protein [Colletotrichum godetiae]|uniref:Major facilitator superfamily domain-containing protein n=1 Tax=Colletotrichum godetiae TaxID=1209918 RepID=A0AAJ0ELN6_9PEZI|nr:major facilitator superfamily domain-containing protein [Colletotrichum godetiae]KAK1656536.1 major facilitator superfamily domain-containing protein [Colletotrichum godetiae]